MADALARFAGIQPQVTVACRTPGEVAEAIALAQRSGLHLAIRSGGHCFAGRSSTTGVVIDVGPMNSISVGEGTATIGAGARLGDVYDVLVEHRVTLAAGCGPTVGITGLALGGGLGILGRRYGLLCDQLLAAQVVLADGSVVECDAEREPDLFWALRGAGGGQFGVVTRLTFRTVAVGAATAFHVVWPFVQAGPLIDAWQRWSPPAPDTLAASLVITSAADVERPPAVNVFGSMIATAPEASALIDDLVGRVGPPVSASVDQMSYRQVKRHLAAHGPGEGQAAEDAHGFSKSEFFRWPLPEEAIAGLVAGFGAGRVPGVARELDFSPWGGAYNRVATDATAFAHREELFLLKHGIAVEPGAPEQPAREWLRRSWETVHPYGSGGVYPNFPDPELEGSDRAYHGANLERLQRVKARYDPEEVFRFPQSLRPARP